MTMLRYHMQVVAAAEVDPLTYPESVDGRVLDDGVFVLVLGENCGHSGLWQVITAQGPDRWWRRFTLPDWTWVKVMHGATRGDTEWALPPHSMEQYRTNINVGPPVELERTVAAQ